MEKRTIGSFIAVLRKSQGMTQKELAEKLNVSDKSVSRWERDETAPDLTLIPVIAEIFGVTSDELLRGQKNPAGTESQAEEPAVQNSKGEKQLKYLFNKTITKFKNQSLISVAITVLGFIILLAFNYGLYKNVLGFGIFSAAVAASVVCQIIFTRNTLAGVDTDDFDEDKLKKLKLDIIKQTLLTLSINIVLFVCAIPLIYIDKTFFTDVILSFDSYINVLPLYLILSVLACIIVSKIAIRIFCKKNNIILPENKKAKKLLIKCAAITLGVIIVSGLLFAIINNCFVDRMNYTGTVCNTFEEFKEIIETPVNSDFYSNSEEDLEEVLIIDREDYKKTMIIDNKKYTYYHLNQDIITVTIRNDKLPITIYSISEQNRNDEIKDNIYNAEIIFLWLELIAGIVIYFIKKKKIA